MIGSKRINIISIILVVITVFAAVFIWVAGMKHVSELKRYNDTAYIYSDEDYYDSSAFSDATQINGGNSKVKIKGKGAYASGRTVYITSGGYYNISGELGNIIVRSSDVMPVMIRFDQANIESQTEPPLYVYRGSECVISSKENTVNYVVDNRKKYSGQSITAAIYSVADLTLNGEGVIYVEANYQDGIVSEKTLKTTSGNVDITSKDDAVEAQRVMLAEGTLSINCEGDGIQAKDNGLIVVDGGTTVINSIKDGFYSDGDIFFNDGSVNLYTGKGAQGSIKRESKNLAAPGSPPEMEQGPSEDAELLPSMKGIKSDGSIHIAGGIYELNTDDDAIHADNDIIIDNGKFTIATGDDAIHSDTSLCVNSGNIIITDCYEGIESKYIEINGGDIDITTIDDGINVIGDGMFAPPPGGGAAPPDAGNNNGGPPQMPPSMNIPDDETTEMSFRMNGGSILVNALGDGIDINGSCEMNGGTIIAFAKTDGPDLAFDFDGVFRMNGGRFVGAGNAGMVEKPSDRSRQHCLMVYPETTYRSGGNVEIQDSSGNTVESFSTDGSFCWIGWYGEPVRTNEKYTVFVDGEVIGEATVSDINVAINPENANRNAPPGAVGGPPPGMQGGGPGGSPPGMQGGGPGGPPPGMQGGGPPPGMQGGGPGDPPPGMQGGGPGGPPPDVQGGGRDNGGIDNLPQSKANINSDDNNGGQNHLSANVPASVIGVLFVLICTFILGRVRRKF